VTDTPTITINDMPFTPIPGVEYPHDYVLIARDIEAGKLDGPSTYRHLIKTDLFFIVYFVLRMRVGDLCIANHGFVVQACKDVETAPPDKNLFLWAREHFKSTIVTLARNLQRIVNNQEITIGVFSYSRENARAFVRQLKWVIEQSEFLRAHFPDVFYENPQKDAPTWSVESLTVKRKSTPKEATVEAWGLIDGMPTGRHFMHRTYDDVETLELVNTPELIEKSKSSFDLSQNLGTNNGTYEVVGTHYHHEGLLNVLRNQKDPETGEPLYHLSFKPATVDGNFNGEPVYLSKDRIKILRLNIHHYSCQQLLDPTPVGQRVLDAELLKDVDPPEIPKSLIKLMLVDGAGDGRAKRVDRSDCWAILVVGVQPHYDELGASNIYILDAVIEDMTRVDALNEIVNLYARTPLIRKVAVEKVALSTTEVHVSTALQARGFHVTLENEILHKLTPAGRRKEVRIADALSWPLAHGKINLSTAIPEQYRKRLKKEMETFPHSKKDDGLDALSYLWDLLTPYMFSKFPKVDEYSELGKQCRYWRGRELRRSRPLSGWEAA
jgi:hypothetical protein